MSDLPPGCSVNDINQSAGEYEEKCSDCKEPLMAYELDENGHCEACVERREEEKAEQEGPQE